MSHSKDLAGNCTAHLMMSNFGKARMVLNLVLCYFPVLYFQIAILLCGTLPYSCLMVESQNTNFTFPNFNSSDQFILVNDSAFLVNDSSFLLNPVGTSQSKGSCGQLYYKDKVRMKDLFAGGAVASFSTSFSFSITGQDSWYDSTGWLHGDGFAFTFASNNSTVGSSGGSMCLIPELNNGNGASNRLFAVEFDTYKNYWFNDPSDSHIGVDINSMNSTAGTYNLCGGKHVNCSYLCNGGDFTAWIDYNATGQTLEVRFTNGSFAAGVAKPAKTVIRVANFNLSGVFNEYMYVGFSASTGLFSEVHKIKSWSFVSSGMPEAPQAAVPSPSPLTYSPYPSPISPEALPGAHTSSKVALISGICGGFAGLLFLVAFCFCLLRWKIKEPPKKQAGNPSNINHLLGPRLFTYKELKKATKNFSNANLLGTGGFGAVYKGTLQPSGASIAVKRIRHESKRAEEGFVAEASSISQIRHRNLVQLQGWCHENGHLMLVYDFMPNGSLDQWIFPSEKDQENQSYEPTVLSWNLRHHILAGVASALAYLHEEWQQCVLHRDIKSSNVLLDADFNAHLADFGLARLIDHKKVDKTTLMAGTLGYMAPEMPYTGKATKESDVFSFGVLMLEVVCGRRPLDGRSAPEDLVLVDSVWRAHESGDLLSVADPQLKPARDSIDIVRDRNLRQSQSSVSGLSNASKDSEFNADSSTLMPLEANAFIAALQGAREENKTVGDLLQLGLLCCNPSPDARPSMRTVNQMLQSEEMEALPALPPCKPLVQYRMMSGSTTPDDFSFASEASLSTIVYINAQGRSRTQIVSQPRSPSLSSLQRRQGQSTYDSSATFTTTSSNFSTRSSSQMGSAQQDLSREAGGDPYCHDMFRV